MQNLQEIFSRIQELKQEQKGIKSMYREALAASEPYKQVLEKISALKAEKLKIETTIKDDYRSELMKLEEVKTNVESDNVLLSDLAMSEYVKGNTVEVVDKYSNKYEPVFNVRFKKVG